MMPSRTLLWSMSGLCLLALALALVAQYEFEMRPCPWCVLQRVLYVLLALIFGVAAWVHARGVKIFCLGLGVLLCGAGVASALYQHRVAAQQFSCGRSLADKIMGALQLDALLPSVFGATASCADAAVSILGVPFALWSLALFIALGLSGFWMAIKTCSRSV